MEKGSSKRLPVGSPHREFDGVRTLLKSNPQYLQDSILLILRAAQYCPNMQQIFTTVFDRQASTTSILCCAVYITRSLVVSHCD